MKRIITSAVCFLVLGSAVAQEEKQPDTTRINLGEKQVIIISPGKVKVTVESGSGATTEEPKENKPEAHWAGLEFGPTILLANTYGVLYSSDLSQSPEYKNDPGKSFSWNLNVLEHKFPIYKNYIGITTGLGINWTQIDMRNYLVDPTVENKLAFTQDTVTDFTKNRLRATYLTVPLLIEVCSKNDGDKGFYFAFGVIGGVRIGSSIKTKTNEDVKRVNKGIYGVNALRADLAVKLGYNNWGVFANLAATSFIETDKIDSYGTRSINPLTFGLTYNF